MDPLKISEVFYEEHGRPLQGTCVLYGEKRLFEVSDGRVFLYELTDDEWRMVDKQPADAVHWMRLARLHARIIARGYKERLPVSVIRR